MKRNYGILRPAMDMLDPSKYPVIALQEPSVNKVTLGIYCSKDYTLSMEPALETKFAFLISNELSVEHWSHCWHSSMISEIKIQLANLSLRVIKFYSPVTLKSELIGWNRLIEAVRNDDLSCILLGDFNCHHSLWGDATAPRDFRAQILIDTLTSEGLSLVTPLGIPTFRRNEKKKKHARETVIDLTFASEDIIDCIYSCKTREDWCLRQDHIPIEIFLGFRKVPYFEKNRFAHHKANIGKIKEVIHDSKWTEAIEPLVAFQEEIIE
ncbi:hypothetical protein Golomagni_01838 [Golovinomyces magnicellulatus]|nr:hypothetical protein Golomagni_01838 [Golovinomyces magnicellulatus]